MAPQQFANNASTTLSAIANVGDASISVVSAVGFPSTVPYTVLIDTEYLLVTSGAGTTTWGVSRAQEGSTAGTHANGATVTQDFTLAGLNSLNQSYYPSWGVSGLAGAVQASRYVGATASGAPGSGTFAVGDFVLDQSGNVWVCVTAGSPGTWRPMSQGKWHFKATASSSQNDSNGSNAIVTFDTVSYDPLTGFNTGGHYFVIPVAGVWGFNAQVASANFTAGDRAMFIYKNGVQLEEINRVNETASGNCTMSGSVEDNFAVNDQVAVYYSSPGSTAGAVQGRQFSGSFRSPL